MKYVFPACILYLCFHFLGCASTHSKAIRQIRQIDAGLHLEFRTTRRKLNLESLKQDLTRADEWLKSGELYKAESLYLETSKKLPENGLIHYNLGVIYDKLNKPEKANESYEKCISLDPGNADALYNLAYNLFQNEQYGEAVLKYLDALALEPFASDIASNLEMSLYKALVISHNNNKLKQMTYYRNTLISFFPDSKYRIPVDFLMALQYFQQNRAEQCINLLDSLPRKAPDSAQYLNHVYFMGETYYYKALCLQSIDTAFSIQSIEKQILLLDSCISKHSVRAGHAFTQKYRLDSRLSAHYRDLPRQNETQAMKNLLLSLAYHERGIENLILAQKIHSTTDSVYRPDYKLIKRELKVLLVEKEAFKESVTAAPLPENMIPDGLESLFYTYKIEQLLWKQALSMARLCGGGIYSKDQKILVKIQKTRILRKIQKYLLYSLESLLQIQNQHLADIRARTISDDLISGKQEIIEEIIKFRKKYLSQLNKIEDPSFKAGTKIVLGRRQPELLLWYLNKRIDEEQKAVQELKNEIDGLD
jgi:tetratricopeptide (TPR) repeat protein